MNPSLNLTFLSLQNFRSYLNKTFAFSQPLTVIVAPNGSGKSNILEAVSLLSTGKSFRGAKEEEMILWGNEFSRIKANVGLVERELLITTGSVGGQKMAKKKYLLDGVGKRKKDFLQGFASVIFQPQDLQLIVGTPSLRRNYLNLVLSQADWKYAHALMNYNKGLQQRNKLLWMIRERQAEKGQLFFWDQHLIKHGQYLTSKRQEFIEFFNDLISQKTFLENLYTHTRVTEDVLLYNIIYDHSFISPERLAQYQTAEIGSSNTLVGPHRDDFILESLFDRKNQSVNLATYGSRGQQRLGILALKMGELAYLKRNKGHEVILLLDDIFSELDVGNQNLVFNMALAQQTIMTTVEEGFDFSKLDCERVKLG